MQNEKNIEPILEILRLLIFENEVDFLNFLNHAKKYIEAKQKLNENENGKTAKDNLEEEKAMLQESIIECLDRIADKKGKEKVKNESNNIC